jgi:ParB family transcriptional regulator, chromosome partitioning protein
VPKAVTLAALAEVGGPAFAGRYASAKKAELAQSCERIFSGDFIGEVEVKDAALAWVPEAMRFAPAPVPAEPEEPKTEAGPGAEAADGTDAIGEDASSAAPAEEIEEAA